MDWLFRGIIYKADNQIKWALADNGFGDFLESIPQASLLKPLDRL